LFDKSQNASRLCLTHVSLSAPAKHVKAAILQHPEGNQFACTLISRKHKYNEKKISSVDQQ